MLVALAWRNLWRNARRTLITLSALALGVAGIVAIHSYREATFRQLTATITAQLVGDLQVHAKGYQSSPEIGSVVKDPITIEAKIAGALPGAVTERRVIGAGLGGAGDDAAGVMIMGVEPGEGMGDIDVVRGKALTNGVHGAVIGTDLADQLGIDVGKDIVLVGQAADGSVANDRYPVVGVADAGTSEMNATAVFLTVQEAQRFFGLGDGVHELVVHLPHAREDESAPLAAVRNALDLRSLEAMSWNQLLPELTNTIKAKRQGQYALDVVIFLIVALGVLNAMTMATFERTRELGVMLALGTRPRRILSMIVLEALLQGVLGLAAGVAVTAAGTWMIGDIHLSGLSRGDMMGVRLPSVVHLSISGESVVAAAVTVGFTMLVGALFPAIRAARLPVVDAMRAD